MPSMAVHDVGKNFLVESVILTFQDLMETNGNSYHWRRIEKLAIDCLLVEPRTTSQKLSPTLVTGMPAY